MFHASAALPQSSETVPQNPMSAIGWLSDVVQDPNRATDPTAPETSTNALPQSITTSPLGQTTIDSVGLFPTQVTGLPRDLWGSSSTISLREKITAQRVDLVAPMAQFLQRIMLAELDAPFDSNSGQSLFLARVDKLLEMGALDPAQAMIEQAGAKTPELFRRWFDVSLLTGREDRVCEAMLKTPDFAPTYPARIFCLARGGDWDAAALTLGTADLLGVVDRKEEALLARFLDPELFEGAPRLPYPDRVTPLNFRMHAAIGEGLSLGTVPNAFAYAALDVSYGWKTRLAAAERLARSSAIPARFLIDLYLEREPAASGGVWDRVDAVQALNTALETSNDTALILNLPLAIRAMRRADLVPSLAANFGPLLISSKHSNLVALDVARMILLSSEYERAATEGRFPAEAPSIWTAVATGQTSAITGETATEKAILSGLSGSGLREGHRQLIDENRRGEALLDAISLLGPPDLRDPSQIEAGLAILTTLNFQDVARRMALHILVLRSL